MWLLLKPLRTTPAGVAAPSDAGAWPLSQTKERRAPGTEDAIAVRLVAGAGALVRMHPGRIEVGRLGHAQLQAQFCLDRVWGVYRDLAAVESIHGDQPGFTLSFEQPFEDSEGRSYESGVVFCDGVRRH